MNTEMARACGTCGFYYDRKTPDNVGECRLQPPVPKQVTVQTLQGVTETFAGIFPPVHGEKCWCGVWRPVGMTEN